ARSIEPRQNDPGRDTPVVSWRRDWCVRHAMSWLMIAASILGAAFLLLDFLDADDRVRTLGLVLLATLINIAALWRAIGLLAGRIEQVTSARRHDEAG